MLVITGGGGFIGSVLAAAAQRGRPRPISSSSTASAPATNGATSPSAISSRSCRSRGCSPGSSGSATRSRRCFISARSRTRPSPTPTRSSRNNLNYSIALWRWCAAARKKPLIYASSAATYGDGSAGFDDAGGIDEFKRLRPLNLYGWSKHAFDLWAMRQAAAGHAPPLWAGLKFFNVFGPNEHHKGDMMSLVVKNYPRIAAGETIRAVQIAPPGLCRWRAAARLRLCQGLRRGDAVAVAP